MPNDTGFIPPQKRAEVADLALRGLGASPKTLPALLFYDEEGCRLFYEITRLPEYYLTRTETGLLMSIGNAVIPSGFRDGALVEFGGSDETKALLVLEGRGSPFGTYVSIDVAAASLEAMQSRLRRTHPDLKVTTVVADFMQPLRMPDLPQSRMGFFPGSTIGNLDPRSATRFLASARASLGSEAWFLLGADLRKSPAILLPAYNDAAGVTAAFNLNLLRRLNREAGADFDPTAFRHQAIWNDKESRIEMHLVSTRAQTVHVAEQAFTFREGETIHTENSYKHTSQRIVQIAAEAGWELHNAWTDDAELFGIFLFRGP